MHTLDDLERALLATTVSGLLGLRGLFFGRSFGGLPALRRLAEHLLTRLRETRFEIFDLELKLNSFLALEREQTFLQLRDEFRERQILSFEQLRCLKKARVIGELIECHFGRENLPHLT